MQKNSDGNPSDGWEIIEEASYERAVAQISSHFYFDEATRPLDYALHRNPLGFSKVPGFDNIYIAKTKLRVSHGEIIPSYILWFSVNIEHHYVYKIWIEIASPEEMGFSENIFK